MSEVIKDFQIERGEYKEIQIDMEPPFAIGGKEFVVQLNNEPFSQSGYFVGNLNSGYGAGQSGITVLNSGQGSLNAAIPGSATSGLDQGMYYLSTYLLTSGQESLVTRGYIRIV